MNSILFTALCLIALGSISASSVTQDPPTAYEYYNGDGRTSGLVAESTGFLLNGKPIRIISGAMHYFRIHPDLWRDRLKKLRAAGAMALETYVPWYGAHQANAYTIQISFYFYRNLHEPQPGVYDFGDGNNDMSSFLNLTRWIRMAEEEDLFVIFRPGPYICSEWEFGGLPSWLSSDKNLVVRSSDPAYEARVKMYFDVLLPMVKDLMWSNGGPVIMIQVENEYGAFGSLDKPHLEYLKSLLEEAQLNELYVTSDSPLTARDNGAIPGVLQTANFYDDAQGQLNALLELQPDKPVMVMEYWSGWFDHWFEPAHNTRPSAVFQDNLEVILRDYNGSVNFYMFHGGTSFGFMAGANVIDFFPYYVGDVSSYDYNSPLTEAGDYTDKYTILKYLAEQYSLVELKHPEMPPQTVKMHYPDVSLQTFLTYDDIIEQIPQTSKFMFNRTVSMEELPINGNGGQSYGYILYRTRRSVGNNSVVEIGRARDMATLIVDGSVKSELPENVLQLLTAFGYWIRTNQSKTITLESTAERNVDLLVENLGRVNFGGPADYEYEKGLHEGSIVIDGEVVQEIETMALEFKSAWVKNLTGWRALEEGQVLEGPVMIQSTFTVDTPADTWLNMARWHKGIVFINGFNLGRYFKVGPPTTLFLPRPLLVAGTNTITIFEQYVPGPSISFSDVPFLG